MTVPLRGMVLAAGFGTRLQPITHRLPKALVPIAGEPILLRVLRWLRREGVTEVVINAHHRAEVLADWVEHGSFDRRATPAIRLLREAEILGTGGGLAQAAPHLLDGPRRPDDPIVVANSDQLFEPDLAAATAHHRNGGYRATLLLARDPWHAQVRVEAGRIREIAPRPVFGGPERWGFSGVYLLSADAVAELRAQAAADGTVRFLDVMPSLRRWMADGRLGGFVDATTPFREIGTPEAWIEVLRELAGPGASWIDPGATVAPDARVEESIVLAGARIEPGAVVRQSILGAGATATGRIERMIVAGGEVRALALLPREEEEAIRAFLARGWPPDRPDGDPIPNRPADASFRMRRLQGDGSQRSLWRIAREAETRVLVLPPSPQSELASVYPRRAGAPSEAETFRYVGTYLATRGVRVPRIDSFEPETGRTLLEDLGSTHLADLLREARRSADPRAEARAESAYEEAVDLLGRMQAEADPPFEPNRTHNLEYDESFILEYEAGYFLRRMAREYCRIEISSEEETGLIEELRGFARRALLGAPRLFLHRDYQSRNLMVTSSGLAVIDFQGARLGPPEYDLVSLVEDPYADLPDPLRGRLIARYLRSAAPPAVTEDPAAFRRRYEATLVNRLLQALGAYAYLGGTLGKPGFLEHAPAALRSLRRRAPIGGTKLEALLGKVERAITTGDEPESGVSHP